MGIVYYYGRVVKRGFRENQPLVIDQKAKIPAMLRQLALLDQPAR